MFQQLKRGQLVIDLNTQLTGKVVGQEGSLTVVEVIISQNKDDGTRTTKLMKLQTTNLRPYSHRKAKSKPYAPYFDVMEFHKAFNHPVAETPTAIAPERASQRADYLVEELVEFLWASVQGNEQKTEELVNALVESTYKAMDKCFGKGAFPKEETLLHQTDALNDISYINYGSIVETGVNPKVIFEIIQNANMSKLDVNGKPILDPETNKIMKPEGWDENHKPEQLIAKEIERQQQIAELRGNKKMSKIQENLIEHTQLAIDTIDDLIINGNALITDLDFSINDADEINKSICLNINFEEGRISNSSNVQLYDDETIEHKTNVFKEQMKRSRNYSDKVMSTNDNG